MDKPIPDSYWVVDGLLLAGPYAGSPTETRARQKLGALLDAGIRAFFDLTEAGELSPYDEVLREIAGGRGIEIAYERVPIRDLGVPDASELHALLSRIAVNVEGGVPSYVHCWGGIGRTGTVIGCWLVEQEAIGGNRALKRIAKLRQGTPYGGLRSPETEEQCALVRGWAETRRKIPAKLPDDEDC